VAGERKNDRRGGYEGALTRTSPPAEYEDGTWQIGEGERVGGGMLLLKPVGSETLPPLRRNSRRKKSL